VGNAAVEAVGVSKRFRLVHERNNSLKATVMRRRRTVAQEFWALRDVSFEVFAGETFGIIGENGSGKSTMLKCLTRILRPDKGTVEVRGKVSALLELGAGFHPELSGRENVFLNGAILGISQRELRRRFDDIVDFAGIHDFIDEPVKNYSSGMYVRLGFSVAINVDPDVLLVDEVLAVGDESFQRRCNEKFAELKASGKTIVVVSHGLSGVQNLCDRVLWLKDGRLMQIGDPCQVIEAYTASLSAERPAEASGDIRWGSGEARITKVELFDSAGSQHPPVAGPDPVLTPTTRLRSGAPAVVRIHYETDEPVARPVFGLGIKTLEGFEVTGPNNRDAGCVPDKIDGSGWVDIRFDPLRLLPGTYDITVALYDFALLHAFDVRENVLRFDVERGPIREQWGVASLGGTWSFSSGAQLGAS
jgi:ABC-type polysaccharide/polyol phosphate transport system ATPase subunit